MNKGRIYIYYNYQGQDITFAFENGYHGRIQGPDHSGLTCYVLNNERDVTIAYIEEAISQKELLIIVINNQ